MKNAVQTKSKAQLNSGRKDELIVRLLIDLYKNGKRTAKELATSYDVCERTIRRKIDVLSCIVPVCVDYGRGGGFYLMPEFKIVRARQ